MLIYRCVKCGAAAPAAVVIEPGRTCLCSACLRAEQEEVRQRHPYVDDGELFGQFIALACLSPASPCRPTPEQREALLRIVRGE